MNMGTRIGYVILGVAVGVGITLGLANQNPSTPVEPIPTQTASGEVTGQAIDEFEDKFDEIFNMLEDNYYVDEDIDMNSMRENALKGFVDAVGDPYTIYLSEEENTSFNEEMEGEQNFEGIDAVVTKKEDGVLIEEVLKGAPAFNAGLMPLDVIIEVDGESTQPLSLFDAVDMIRGPKGTDVTLTVFRERSSEVLDIVVTRDAISVPSVKVEEFEYSGQNMLSIEIAVFGDDTKSALTKEIFERQMTDVDGIILDVRGNGGGYLQTAVDIASFFLEKGLNVVTAKYTTYPDEVYSSHGLGFLEGKPVVVLIDGLSASASEILAASLSVHLDAPLVGSVTFGKGSIQTLYEIDDGSSVKYTIGRRYTPQGVTVDQEGLKPDVEIEFDRDTYVASGVDNQLEQAKVELLDILSQ